tara:strand:+ start:317 stop:475 length:159 start_codon:yes stop_codon:yes gene_type:complete
MVLMNKDNLFIFGEELSKRQIWKAKPGFNSVGLQNTQLHFMKYSATTVFYLK